MRTFKSFRTRKREAIAARASRMGKASQRVQAERRMAGPKPVYPPMRGDLLLVERVTNPIQGCSVEYIIRMGKRLNGIEVWSFGRRLPKVGTWTKFFDLRRRRMAVKWLTD